MLFGTNQKVLFLFLRNLTALDIFAHYLNWFIFETNKN
jgi:hypothetical protein